jgi:hypothetical protein
MRVNLKNMPKAQETYVVDFPKLNGGLNIRELNYRLEPNQSPNMKNLWWQDGVLQCRDGQRYLSDSTALGTGYACAEGLFWGHAFFHIGTAIYAADMREVEVNGVITTPDFSFTAIVSNVPENRGTFFRYDACLFYKNRGGFFKISHNASGTPTFTAVDMSQPVNACTPVIVLNADPDNGSGDTYQPENRLSPRKTVKYNAKSNVRAYHLPVKDIEKISTDPDRYCIVKILESGQTEPTEKTEGTDYTVNAETGVITFTTAPPVTNPPTNNTVEITYSKANNDAKQSIMDCTYAAVAGEGKNLCILLAGCTAQPNAVFWNANDQTAMNAGYYPMPNYNRCGDADEPVTGFGKQYNDLILLKESSVGKLAFSIETVDGRDSISFTYETINARIGCDLPWTIQLIENNLVFCNTHRGVHLIQSSSAALENNVVCISENVNGSGDLGLLHDVRAAAVTVSADDDARYWLCAGGHVYAWDYEVSSWQNPSWFYFTEINGVAFFHDDTNGLYHLDASGRVTKFERSFADYPHDVEVSPGKYNRVGDPIDKIYTFPTQYFGSYDRLKDVLYLLVTVRSDTDTEVKLRYDTDYERRVDLTPILSYAWRIAPRNLAHRSLVTARYGHVAKRAPKCRHIRHFSLTLGNKVSFEDLAIVSAQIYYRYQGKER